MEGGPTGAEADVEAVPKETIATGERCEKIECTTTTPGGADIDEPAAFGRRITSRHLSLFLCAIFTEIIIINLYWQPGRKRE